MHRRAVSIIKNVFPYVKLLSVKYESCEGNDSFGFILLRIVNRSFWNTYFLLEMSYYA